MTVLTCPHCAKPINVNVLVTKGARSRQRPLAVKVSAKPAPVTVESKILSAMRAEPERLWTSAGLAAEIGVSLALVDDAMHGLSRRGSVYEATAANGAPFLIAAYRLTRNG